MRFEPLPPPTTADVQELTATIARRLKDRLAAAWEAEGSDYLDPALAALCEAFFHSRTPPVGKKEGLTLPGLEAEAIQSKPVCASVDGISLHAAQSVPAHDREAIERLLRYGLRAPCSQERLSRSPDGKVVYRLRRPWPNEHGATHLILDPLDFLRRLAALVSFPYAHQIRYHGLFANRSRMRRLLLPPPPRQGVPGIESAPAAGQDVVGGLRTPTAQKAPLPSTRRRSPWAQLHRLLHVDALACPRCSSVARSLPMVVLAFLTDPEVVGRILRHLGLPTYASAWAPARSVLLSTPLWRIAPLLSEDFGLPAEEEDRVSDRGGIRCWADPSPIPPAIRPPP